MKAPRKFSFEDTTTGHPPHEDAVIKEAVKQFRHLLSANWSFVRAEREGSDTNSASVSVSFTFQHAAKKPVVKGKITVKRVSPMDESDGIVEDPNQKELLPEEGGAK